jgi:small-conductance mechanosensitive channel
MMDELLEATQAAQTNPRLALLTLLIALGLGVVAELGLRLFERGLRRTSIGLIPELIRALHWWLFALIAVPGALVALSLMLVPAVRPLALIAANWFVAIGVAFGFIRALTEVIRFFMLRHGVGNVTILRNVMFALGGLVLLAVVLELLGISIGPLVTIIAGSSVGVAFALREPLSNLFAGIQMIASDRVRPGQFVRLSGGQEGTITDIHWSDTYLRHPANNLVIVPNSKMTQEIVINYDRPDPALSVTLDLGVSYDSDLDHVERVTIAVADEVMREVAGGLPEFSCVLRYNAISDFAVRFSVVLRATSFGDQFLIRHELIKRLLRRYRQEGIIIPFPTQTIASPDNSADAAND